MILKRDSRVSDASTIQSLTYATGHAMLLQKKQCWSSSQSLCTA